MEEAYTIAREWAMKSADWNKQRYDTKPQSIELQPNKLVLVQNLSERGGPGELHSYWEMKIHIIISHIVPMSPGDGRMRLP